MPYYHRRPQGGETSGNPLDGPAELARKAVGLTRALLPFPGAVFDPVVPDGATEDLPNALELTTVVGDEVNAVMRSAQPQGASLVTALSRTAAIDDVAGDAMPAVRGAEDAIRVSTPVIGAGAATDQAGALLPRAAGILDEEMARGALAAHAAKVSSAQKDAVAGKSYAASPAARAQETATFLGHGFPSLPLAGMPPATGSGDLVRDLYGFVDRFAGLLSRPEAAAERASGTSTLVPRNPTSPGSTTTMAFDLQNEEARRLVLRPAATALISEEGAQLSPECVRCERDEIILAPGEQQTLRVSVQIPGGATPGCYTGLLVLTGVAQLHTLIQVKVESA